MAPSFMAMVWKIHDSSDRSDQVGQIAERRQEVEGLKGEDSFGVCRQTYAQPSLAW